MAETQRLFLGSFISPESLEPIVTWRQHQQAWADSQPTRIRWVSDAQLHLTWRFLGDTPVHQIEALQQALSEALAHCSLFTLTFDRLEIWPHAKKPQVLVWRADSSPGCEAVVHAVQAACGVKNEHDFKPHVTVARVKPQREYARYPMVLPEPPKALSWEVRDVHLIQSILKPKGAEYQLLKSWMLK